MRLMGVRPRRFRPPMTLMGLRPPLFPRPMKPKGLGLQRSRPPMKPSGRSLGDTRCRLQRRAARFRFFRGRLTLVPRPPPRLRGPLRVTTYPPLLTNALPFHVYRTLEIPPHGKSRGSTGPLPGGSCDHG